MLEFPTMCDSRQDEAYSDIRGWFVIRFQEEGLRRNAGRGKEGAP